MRTKLFAATLGFALVAVSTLHASFVFVSTRGGLGGNDNVNWEKLGSPGDLVTLPPRTVSSYNGLNTTVSSSGLGGVIQLRQQDIVGELYAYPTGWQGNFEPDDYVLYNFGNGGDISITFATGIYGVGAQVQANYLGHFQGTIAAFGEHMEPLFSYTFSGDSTEAKDNSAVFAGIRSSDPDIYTVSFITTTPVPAIPGFGFGINQLTLLTTPVPEPSTFIAGALALLPVGASALRILRKRRAA
jgi:hypothetical protein